jgi:hypothetical protein
MACFTSLPFYFPSCIADRDFTPGVSVLDIGICCFSAKHTSLRRESKEWLARNQDDVLEWGDMSMLAVSFIHGGNRRTRDPIVASMLTITSQMLFQSGTKVK